MYIDVNGKRGTRGLVGESGTTYGNLALFSAEELAAALADGIVEVQPAPPPVRTLEQLKHRHKGNIQGWFNEQVTVPVVVPDVSADIGWVGGYESALKLDAGRRFGTELGRPSITFVDAENNVHQLTKPDADKVVQGVAAAYEALYVQYVSLLKQTDQAASEAEFPAVPEVTP